MIKNPECYAQRLCDCQGSANREHVVSESLLRAIWQGAKGGLVNGLTFLRNNPQNPATLGIKSLTAKILCEHHNRSLSPFDAEITKLFNAMERLLNSEIEGDPVAINTYINGDFIERWMLKTLLNGVFSATFFVPFVSSFEGILPPVQLLQILYRQASLAPRRGVYVAQESLPVNADNVFNLAVVGDPSGIIGLRMWMLGTLFILVLTDEHTPFPELRTATYRPTKISTIQTRNAINFSWTGNRTNIDLQVSYVEPPVDHNES